MIIIKIFLIILNFHHFFLNILAQYLQNNFLGHCLKKVFDNMYYTQYRWDDRSMFYYVDSEGNLVQRINQGYTYPTGTST